MCEHCHMEYCCLHGHYGRRYYPRPYAYYDEPAPLPPREYLEEEKSLLERRLKALEARLQQLEK